MIRESNYLDPTTLTIYNIHKYIIMTNKEKSIKFNKFKKLASSNTNISFFYILPIKIIIKNNFFFLVINFYMGTSKVH